MKNITIKSLNKDMGCEGCNKTSYMIYNHEDMSYVSCPICGLLNVSLDEKGIFLKFLEEVGPGINCYCKTCNILYDYNEDCFHYELYKEILIYYGTVISKWEYQGTVYEGMIEFDNFEECMEKCSKIKILEVFCSCVLNNCNRCIKDSSKEPDYDCNCIKSV